MSSSPRPSIWSVITATSWHVIAFTRLVLTAFSPLRSGISGSLEIVQGLHCPRTSRQLTHNCLLSSLWMYYQIHQNWLCVFLPTVPRFLDPQQRQVRQEKDAVRQQVLGQKSTVEGRETIGSSRRKWKGEVGNVSGGIGDDGGGRREGWRKGRLYLYLRSPWLLAPVRGSRAHYGLSQRCSQAAFSFGGEKGSSATICGELSH